MPKNGTVETVETVATVPGVCKLQKIGSELYGKSQELYGTSQELYGKLQELYGESHGLYWNALTAWQISIFKFAFPLNIFNYTPL